MKKINFDYKKVPLHSWIWVAIYAILTIGMAIWTRNVWVFIIVFPFLFDICITHIIPWRWWEKSNSKALKSFMKLIEDLVVVLIVVHMLNLFIFQNFKIPSSSLEKTYLVGDYLYVSKLSYGPRVPMTPLAFPLFHNQFPWGGKTYSEKPQWEYKRLKGLREIKLYDIVVFNFPAGDTICTKKLNPDYYTTVHMDGRDRVWNDKQTYGEIQYRPVDMRDHYVKRLAGMPGDSLAVIDNDLYLNGVKQERPKEMQLNYYVQTNGAFFTNEELQQLGVSNDDVLFFSGQDPRFSYLYQSYLKLDSVNNSGYGAVYHMPLTEEMKTELSKHSAVKKIVIEPTPDVKSFPTYPLNLDTGWTRDNYGPIWIPKKGATITLTPENLEIYDRCIRNFERHNLEIKDGKAFIDGVQSDTYTFAMDYYFMLGDNRHRSADSRAWGFVPEDHIVGTPLFVWLSWDKDKKGVRWNRFFKLPK